MRGTRIPSASFSPEFVFETSPDVVPDYATKKTTKVSNEHDGGRSASNGLTRIMQCFMAS